MVERLQKAAEQREWEVEAAVEKLQACSLLLPPRYSRHSYYGYTDGDTHLHTLRSTLKLNS